jgi:porin
MHFGSFDKIVSALIGFIFAFSISDMAAAAPPPVQFGDDSDTQTTPSSDLFDFSGLQRSSTMLGTMGGLRPWLSQYGMSLGIEETSEVLGNATGGIHQSAAYDGLTQMVLQMDTQRAFGWYGGTFNASAFQIHGRSLSADNLETLQTASGIEADRSTRLWELWYDQKFLDEDRLDVKIGQQSLDNEFMVSNNALLFVNTMFGWPMLPSADMPGGGPAYPLSALGVRARAKPTDSLTWLTGVYNGSPTATNNGDPQMTNPSGTSFPLNGGTLIISELQYAYPAIGGMVSPDQTRPLSGTYKIGFWYDTENFADQEYNNDGTNYAVNPTGNPLQHHGDYAFYAVADQMIWQDDETEEAERTLNFFTRVMGTPLADRNLIDFSMNAGFTLHEPFEHRDDDAAGIGMGYAHVSSQVAALDNDFSTTGTYTPTQTSETFIEVTYQYQIFPWWQVQPDFQYVFNPGGGVLDPNTGARVRDEAVFGLRTNITF